MKCILSIFIIFFSFTTNSFSQEIKKDSISFFYESNQYHLNTSQIKQLQAVISDVKPTEILIKGYADYVGSKDYNQKLSERRCTLLSKYLENQDFKNINTIGFGELVSATKTANGNAKHRKTTLIYTVTPKTATVEKYAYLNALTTIKKDETITLKHINFMLASDSIMRKSMPELEALKEILIKNPYLYIQIEGHVCCGMEKEIKLQKTTYENKWLSEIRANKIATYLIENGIDSTKINKIGYGFLKPLTFPEITQKDKLQNRRIEVRVLSNNYIEKLNDISVNEHFVLRNIYFEYGLHKLIPKSFEEIENIYAVLNNNPNLKIEIQGHVCCGKNDEAKGDITSQYNTRLSTNRAIEVRMALMGMGIDENRITAKGYGFSKPKYFPETLEEHKSLNRRTEIKLIAK